MKTRLKLVACSLFLSVGTLAALALLDNDNFGNAFNSSTVKASTSYSLTLNATNKYVGGNNQNVSTDRDVNALVQFAYTNASQSNTGHVVLGNGGTLKNVDQLTSVSYFIPSFSLSNGASLKFRASNDGVNWGDFASIKPYSQEISDNTFETPYMRYIEFKAEGGSVDIESIQYCYTCLESDNQDNDNYEIGTTYVDANIGRYTTTDTFNSLSSGITVSKLYNGGATEALNANSYNISVKNPSGNEINKSENLVVGTHTVTISRKDKAFADISYNFDVIQDRFTVTTDLTETKEIHTSQQKQFLSYSGDYLDLTANDYPNGTSHLSDALPVNLTWNFSPASGKTVSKYSVTFGQYADLSDGYEVVGTTSKSIDLYNVFLGTNYFKIAAKYTDNSVEYSSIKTFVVDDTCPRNLTITSMTNCRDMGGRTTIFGGKVKQGLIYRTSGKNQNGTWSSSAVKETMVNQLGLKNEIYIADTNQYEVGPSIDVNTFYAYMDYNKNDYNSLSHFSRNTESVKNVFKILSDESNYPLFYHCKIGTDRTGLVAILVNGILGVPLNEIYQDYLFSNFGKIGSQRVIGNGDRDDIANYMTEINAMPGNNFQEKTYNTLLAIGVPASQLDTVINLLTEGPKPNNAQGQIGLNVNQMVVQGGNVVYTERTSIVDRQEPEYYLKLTSSASASYSFSTTSSGTARIYAYLGHNDRTTSKYINTSVSVSIDNVNVSIPSTNFEQAGMGYCSGNRTNYYFVSLGEVSNLAAGEHTIKISGLANDMKLGRLSVFGVPATVDENQGNYIPPVEPIRLRIAEALSSGCHTESTKLGGDGGDAVWSVTNSTIPAGTYKVSIGFKSTSSSHSSRTFMDGSNPTYTFYVNDTGYSPNDTTSTRDQLGINANSFTVVEYVTSLTIPANLSQIKVGYTGTSGYRMYISVVELLPLD